MGESIEVPIQGRDNSVSMSKGVAILLMVLVHARFSHYGDTFINMFHMPLFFFMSGYCFKEEYLKNFSLYAKKRIIGAYWPFVKWGLLFLLLHNFFYELNIYNGEFGYRGITSQLYTFNDLLKRSLLIVGSLNGDEQLLGGYWFLHTYFFAAFITFGTILLFKRCLRLVIIGGLVLLIISMLMIMYDLKIPFYIQAREVLASSFMVTGFAYKQSNWHIEEKPLMIIPIGVVIVAIGVSFWPCGMLSLTWQKIVPYYFSALFGTMMVFGICKLIIKYSTPKRVLTYVGDKTLDILTWHFLSFKLVSIIIIALYGLPQKQLAEFPVIEEFAYQGWFIPYFIVGALIPLLIELLLRKLNVICRKISFAFHESK